MENKNVIKEKNRWGTSKFTSLGLECPKSKRKKLGHSTIKNGEEQRRSCFKKIINLTLVIFCSPVCTKPAQKGLLKKNVEFLVSFISFFEQNENGKLQIKLRMVNNETERSM